MERYDRIKHIRHRDVEGLINRIEYKMADAFYKKRGAGATTLIHFQLPCRSTVGEFLGCRRGCGGGQTQQQGIVSVHGVAAPRVLCGEVPCLG